MPRVVSLILPTFPTDRIRKSGRPRSSDGAPPADAPLVTAATDGPRRVVAAADAAALAIGIRPGHALAQAQASVPNLAIADADPDGDARALTRLAGWCLRYAPIVQPDPPDGLFLDIAGAAHLFGGETALLDDLTTRLRQAGFAAEGAVADTPASAWALARHAPGTICPPGKQEEALLPLPVAALRLPDSTCQELRFLGMGRIGDLARTPSSALIRRLGPDVVRRCDRAFGRAEDPLTPFLPRDAARARLAFAEPLSHAEALGEAVSRLAQRLCRDLTRRDEGVRQLDAVFQRVDGRPIGLRIGTAAPSRDPAHLAKLLMARLPEIDPGFGIDEIALTAVRADPMTPRQSEARAIMGSDDPLAPEDALAPLVDKLSVRLGAERVFRAAPVESHYPERSVRRVPALADAGGASWPADLPRPSRIIDPPEPVSAVALLPDNPPSYFVWRRVRYLVRGADGPERIRGEWWRAEGERGALRDYYRVEDEAGRRFWLFRDAEAGHGPRWWLHGRFS